MPAIRPCRLPTPILRLRALLLATALGLPPAAALVPGTAAAQDVGEGRRDDGAPAAGAQAQENGSTRRLQNDSFALDLPAGWRALTVRDLRTLGDRLPFELRAVRRGSLAVYGPVEQWLGQPADEPFTGEALITVFRPGEVAADAEGTAELRAAIEAWRGPDGRRREVLDARPGTIGPDGHPAVWIRTRTMPGDAKVDPGAPPRPVAVAREAYVPSGGRLLILGAWSWDTRATDVPPDSPPDWARSTTIARRPRGPEQPGDQLLTALAIGVGLTALLLILHRQQTNRRVRSS